MKMSKEIRKESSVPVVSRVSMVDLAKMDLYWMRVEGVTIKTMSQLVSWTFTALCDIIEANGKMPKGVNSVVEAHKYLEIRGLYQQSMRKKSQSRIMAAMGFENLRKQGSDPEYHSQDAYKVVHSKHSAEPFNGEINAGHEKGFESKLGIDWEKVSKKVKEEKEKEREEELSKAVKAAEDAGVLREESGSVVKTTGLRRMSNEECDEWEKDILKHDEERKALENAPFKEEDFKLVKDENEGNG